MLSQFLLRICRRAAHSLTDGPITAMGPSFDTNS
uniref:Uncharacterized protein n=1 Tax=Arundo donax TaxID=35708 RepID=A0A0A9GXX5_ARUDO